ncbi:MAG: adenosine deaminase [Spirochaetaceae bacterium]
MDNIKKVELHLHLDGSLRIETVKELGVNLGLFSENYSTQEIKNKLCINKDDKTLVDYLEKFNLPIQILQTKDSLERVAYEIVEDLSLENTIYAEIRVAPIQHMKEGLTGDDIVEAILKGFNKASSKYPITVNLLLCAMRHLPAKDNEFLLTLADKYKKLGVVGLDLAGDEAGYSVDLFRDFFNKAKKIGIPFTIHAGEASGTESIVKAIEIGAKRLGHGIRAYEDEDVMDLIKKRDICLECCPKSNLDTNAIKDFNEYPIIKYLNVGIAATLNSDNRTVSDTNYDKELLLLNRYLTINTDDIKNFNINAINHAFISEDKKEQLLNQLN